jgi:hypothetical protein
VFCCPFMVVVRVLRLRQCDGVEPLPAGSGFGLNMAVAPVGRPEAVSSPLPGIRFRWWDSPSARNSPCLQEQLSA